MMNSHTVLLCCNSKQLISKDLPEVYSFSLACLSQEYDEEFGGHIWGSAYNLGVGKVRHVRGKGKKKKKKGAEAETGKSDKRVTWRWNSEVRNAYHKMILPLTFC